MSESRVPSMSEPPPPTRSFRSLYIISTVGLAPLILGISLLFARPQDDWPGAVVGFGAWMTLTPMLALFLVKRRMARTSAVTGASTRTVVSKDDGRARATVAPQKIRTDELVRRWRRIEVGNTFVGVVVSVLVVAFLAPPVAAIVVVFVALGTADTWYLGRRLRRTGKLFRTRSIGGNEP